ncbi:hypothetical protein LCM20_08705 [Halobacillus litoralis]|uniref:hypothetical protein n=1 Tax=Halobacillus litoralis TaxID=45668 RepID=UPI001CD3A4DF|nr:hypothetical protein [Halobacillus litoralis]MCA0970665.1 hypothetical protein [Halobacillus litoralis]
MPFQQVFLSDMYLGGFIAFQLIATFILYRVIKRNNAFPTKTQKIQSTLLFIISLLYSFSSPYIHAGAFVALNQHFSFQQNFIVLNLVFLSVVFLALQYLLYSLIQKK